jgi:small conductance mechanosensitive channel
MDVIKSDERVLADPEPVVAVSALADSSVNFNVRPWVKTEDYWGVYFDMLEEIKIRLDKEGINIPFPQMDVHLKKED